MAYSFTKSVRPVGPNGAIEIVIHETDCGAADEATIDDGLIPAQGTVIRQECILVSGTAAKVVPVLGTQPNPVGTQYVVCQEDAPGKAIVDNQGVATYDIVDTSPNRLYHRSRPDAGADNVITSVYHVITRWA